MNITALCENEREVYATQVKEAKRMYIRLISLNQEEIKPDFSAKFKVVVRSGIGFG